MDYYESHHELFQLFGGYLNQSWLDIYIWDGREPSYSTIIRKYKTEDSKEGIKKTISELKNIIGIAKHYDEEKWGNILTWELGLGYDPSGDNLTYREWLEDVLKILEEPREETLKHFIPERV